MSNSLTPVGRVAPNISGPTLATGVIADPPRNLAALASGTIVKGTIVGRGSDGLVTVAIDQGTVKVATNAQLPPGSSVTLEIRNAGDRLQVLILAVENSGARPAQAPLPQTPQPAGATAPIATNPSGIAPPPAGAPVGTASTGPASTGAATGTGTATAGNAASGTVRPADAPVIQVVGSTLKGVVVQTPPAASLLNIPDPDPGFFALPAVGPVSTPEDAVLKAQLLTQTLQIVAPDALATPSAPSGIAVESLAVGETSSGTAPSSPSTLPDATSPPAAGTALQPQIAARILALFEADVSQLGAGAGAASPLAVLNGPTPLVPTTAAAAGLSGQIQIAAAAPPMLPAGTELTLHVIAVLPGQGQPIEIAPEAGRLASAAAPLIGRVLGFTKAGFPVVDTPAGAVMIQQKAQLPVGAQVALAFEVDRLNRAEVLPIPATPQQAMLYFSRGWPTLEDLFTVLGAAAPAQGDPDSALTRLLPQSGPKLAAGLINAAAALRSGDVEQLLGSLLALRKLPAGKEDIVKRLRQEFSQISELAKDPPDADWRALFLPLYDERIGLSQINLYYRQGHGSGKDDPERKSAGTRFVVEVNFALLGAFQLDGLVRRKRFDLMIRSRKRLTQSQRREIHEIFQEALELGGYAGSLEFRTVETFPVAPLDEMQQSHSRLTA